MCVVVAAAAVADMSAADAWLLMLCLQAAAGVGVFAKHVHNTYCIELHHL